MTEAPSATASVPIPPLGLAWVAQPTEAAVIAAACVDADMTIVVDDQVGATMDEDGEDGQDDGIDESDVSDDSDTNEYEPCPRVFVDLRACHGLVDFNKLCSKASKGCGSDNLYDPSMPGSPVDLMNAKEPLSPIHSPPPKSAKRTSRHYEGYDISDPFVDDSELVEERDDRDEGMQSAVAGFFIQAGAVPVKTSNLPLTQSQRDEEAASVKRRRAKKTIPLPPLIESAVMDVERQGRALCSSGQAGDGASLPLMMATADSSALTNEKRRIPKQLNGTLIELCKVYESYCDENKLSSKDQRDLHHSILARLEASLGFTASAFKSRMKTELARYKSDQLSAKLGVVESSIKSKIDSDVKQFDHLVEHRISDSTGPVSVARSDDGSVKYKYHPRWSLLFINDFQTLIKLRLDYEGVAEADRSEFGLPTSAHGHNVLRQLFDECQQWWPSSLISDRKDLQKGIIAAIKHKLKKQKSQTASTSTAIAAPAVLTAVKAKSDKDGGASKRLKDRHTKESKDSERKKKRRVSASDSAPAAAAAGTAAALSFSVIVSAPGDAGPPRSNVFSSPPLADRWSDKLYFTAPSAGKLPTVTSPPSTALKSTSRTNFNTTSTITSATQSASNP